MTPNHQQSETSLFIDVSGSKANLLHLPSSIIALCPHLLAIALKRVLHKDDRANLIGHAGVSTTGQNKQRENKDDWSDNEAGNRRPPATGQLMGSLRCFQTDRNSMLRLFHFYVSGTRARAQIRQTKGAQWELSFVLLPVRYFQSSKLHNFTNACLIRARCFYSLE